jgi:hypothetical protein
MLLVVRTQQAVTLIEHVVDVSDIDIECISRQEDVIGSQTMMPSERFDRLVLERYRHVGDILELIRQRVLCLVRAQPGEIEEMTGLFYHHFRALT